MVLLVTLVSQPSQPQCVNRLGTPSWIATLSPRQDLTTDTTLDCKTNSIRQICLKEEEEEEADVKEEGDEADGKELV